MNVSLTNKITTRDNLIGLCEQYRARGVAVGFTTGTFDILHPGHVSYLEQARQRVGVLVVGVNSDDSVRKYKNPDRPVNPEAARARVVAGLGSVDHVFIFPETNNHQNISVLRPDLYIKAGDYSPEKLTSKSLVESYGGRVEIIPFEDGFSSTSVIEKIELAAKSVRGEDIRYERRPAIFVDRDGTINEHVEYLSEPEKFKEIPSAFASLRRLKEAGYRIVVITNQPGIGLGYFSKEDLFAVNREMLRQATKAGLSVDRIYFCPHSKADNCKCRKPSTYLIQRAAEDLNVDVGRSFMIGDMSSDIQLAKNAGCEGVLVKTGRGGDDGICEAVPDIVAANLAEAADRILERGPVKVEVGAVARLESSEEAVVQAIGKFGGDIGHDYNNILGSALACVDLIRQRIQGTGCHDDVEDILKILEKATRTGVNLSNRIRGFARTGEVRKSEMSLLKSVTSVVEILSQSRKQTFNYEIVCPEDLSILASDFTVTQTILQLCENSLDAMKDLEERFVLFGISKVAVADAGAELGLARGDYVVLSISDHGKGISTKRQEQVFHPFTSSKGRGVGKGLGLSMASATAVMKQHGGVLALASNPGIGTTIRLYFPAQTS